MKTRCKKYLATWDDGHDWGEFSFDSCHRANSKANLEDAKKEAFKKYGLSRSRCMKIVQTHLKYDC